MPGFSAPRFSANLGLLFTDLPLASAVRAAAASGFSAVEFHFPHHLPRAPILQALADTALPLLSLNTAPGTRDQGEFGLAALADPARARANVDEALDSAQALGAGMVHVMAGRTDGEAAAEAAYRATLDHACRAAARMGLTIVIEPINSRDVPGYHLSTVEHAAAVIDALGHDNLRIMFDIYHVQIMQGDITQRLRRYLPMIGHIQIAGVPDRGPPNTGELDFGYLCGLIADLGWQGHIGAEYRPGGDTAATLGWLDRTRKVR